MASSDDEDLKAAIAMSLAAQENGDLKAASPNISNPVSSFLGLDRKAMEEERLARARKRERSISPPSTRKAPKVEVEVEENPVLLPSGARLNFLSTLVSHDQKSKKSGPANAAIEHMKQQPSTNPVKKEVDEMGVLNSASAPHGSMQYPNGVVKKTWAFGFDRTPNDIKLEEVLEPNSLRTAVLSAFQWDIGWVMNKLKIPPKGGKTKCVFVMEAKSDDIRDKWRQESEDMKDYLRLCFPPMHAPIFCMHSKLMLLFHPQKLRIAIPTANLLDFDWGETGVMENSVFMIDLPRLSDGGKNTIEELTAFGKELMFFIELQGLDQDVRDGVLNFDFKATQNMMFVHTAGGTHFDGYAERTGLLGLGRAVRELNLTSDESLEIDFAASSIGSLNDEFLTSIHAAARGEHLIARAQAATAATKANFFKPPSKKAPGEGAGIRDKLRIYFPTYETVTSSRAGTAGTICLDRKWFEGDKFPKTCFRDYRSVRTGLLSHNKILLARGTQTDASGVQKDVAWAYVGSANMSMSAWGQVVYDKPKKQWKITCRNWECGVILPVPADRLGVPKQSTETNVKKEKIDGEDSETESEDENSTTNGPQQDGLVGIDVFDNVVNPPFEIPGNKYDGREPWYFKEPH